MSQLLLNTDYATMENDFDYSGLLPGREYLLLICGVTGSIDLSFPIGFGGSNVVVVSGSLLNVELRFVAPTTSLTIGASSVVDARVTLIPIIYRP